MIDEARLEQTEYGLAPATEGWFTVNVRDAAWVTNEAMGAACIFEGDAVAFGQIGYTLAVLQPGQPSGMYHREDDQEDFLVLSGECLAIVEGEERTLRAWDFLHCPPGTEHIFVGAGDGPCVIFMAGARANRGSALYTRDEAALRHGAGVETETPESSEAYARLPEVAARAAGRAALLAGAGGVGLARRRMIVRLRTSSRTLTEPCVTRVRVSPQPSCTSHSRAADRRRAVAALGAELALAVAPQLARLRLLLRRRRSRRAARAARAARSASASSGRRSGSA